MKKPSTKSAVQPAAGDGPASPLFEPIPFSGNCALVDLAKSDLSATLRHHLKFAPSGRWTAWGIPFQIGRVALARSQPVTLRWRAVRCPWLVFMHTADLAPLAPNSQGFIPASPGVGRLNEHLADYVLLYADGTEARAAIRRRHQLGMITRPWGENCFEAVVHHKPHPVRTTSEQPREGVTWGSPQTRVAQPDLAPWLNWLWAWEHPHPKKGIVGMRIEPKGGALILSGISGGKAESMPLRWQTRRKAILRLPDGEPFDPNLDRDGLLKHLRLDLGQVISALPRTLYPNADWARSYHCQPPKTSATEILVEYTAHPEARFHFADGTELPVARLANAAKSKLAPVPAATQRVRLRVIDESKQPVAVKLHVHGAAGEYLAPVDRHRIPNDFWYEDWAVEYVNAGRHYCTYIPGETVVDLPLGKVFVEISKGFEIAPIRQVAVIKPSTRELTFTLERVLPWRARGWVTADTHVHFLSPPSAQLEGAAEGVNVVNLLASQWGELMTNPGDFDGRTTFGSREAGGDGEYLVRVGTENRQHVLGHISLLGYNGSIIAPMTVGGPDESALGDPVEVLLTEWSRQCRRQGGVVIVPHFPNPRAEHAATIISGEADAVEMTSWGDLYGGIDPYSLSDWYRYLNCGHFIAAVGGTDKMDAKTAIGAVRTYARLPKQRRFDFEAWKNAIRAGHTFVTYGPLMEFSVEGKPPGSRLKLNRTGGTVEVEWEAASVTVPMTRVELVVNGEVRESRAISTRDARGHWSVRLERSSWIALLIRGQYPDRPEIVAAHSSPVMVEVKGTPFFSAADSLTILEQIEGALAFLDTIGTRAEDAAYKRMRMILVSAHRSLHNRLHSQGVFHHHGPGTDHAEHHRS